MQPDMHPTLTPFSCREDARKSLTLYVMTRYNQDKARAAFGLPTEPSSEAESKWEETRFTAGWAQQQLRLAGHKNPSKATINAMTVRS